MEIKFKILNTFRTILQTSKLNMVLSTYLRLPIMSTICKNTLEKLHKKQKRYQIRDMIIIITITMESIENNIMPIHSLPIKIIIILNLLCNDKER